ncbi:MAG: hypothetical protein AAFU85_17195 [Planctomycetota bacterium]
MSIVEELRNALIDVVSILEDELAIDPEREDLGSWNRAVAAANDAIARSEQLNEAKQ